MMGDKLTMYKILFPGGCQKNHLIMLTLFLIVSLLITCCKDNPTDTMPDDPIYGSYDPWETSNYVLPFPVGSNVYVIQGNCTPSYYRSWNSHQYGGIAAYGYDFLVPIGTIITASRSGKVVEAVESHYDTDKTSGNYIIIEHNDSTYGIYYHLTLNGVLVNIGQYISQGDTIALSGNSGNSETPHLHFQVNQRKEIGSLPPNSIPVTFRNTTPNPTGLKRDMYYKALAY